ncbi:hypothetical protein Poli38472_000361 [Pythium oligandrum]|uniref:Ubiquitin-like domain-containing protein n=1 Tax=Pythium oligandrum TaxID=41045 RepID=A0A8K1CC55_PYTOL|nr:hypothetical protein Poli38472_000361 [Pythium oligandrum]|eukprot:TMW60319.1 hypothetical protein Poli38472_000361 [Pythium oligandrum]
MATIKVTVKNDRHAFTLETTPHESVAGVKAAYQESGKNVWHPNYIVLLHKGKELADEKTLAELGITDGDMLVHIEPTHEPFRPVNYKALAQSFSNRRKHEEANLKMMKEDNIWAAGEDGTVHRLGIEKSLISTNGVKSPHFAPPPKKTSARSFFSQLSVRVNACTYHVLPALEGRWNGELATVPPKEDGNQVCSMDLAFRDDEGVWSQRQSRTTISGLTSTQHFWIKPVADGILKIETDDPTLRNSDITMQELGLNVIIITATSKRTGQPIMVETMTVIDTSRRIRTIQRFDESGAFRSVYVMNERRVMDSVSGAMEKYENVF